MESKHANQLNMGWRLMELQGASDRFAQWGQHRVGNGEGFHLGTARDHPASVRTEVMA